MIRIRGGNSVQVMSILIVNQSVIDMLASVFILTYSVANMQDSGQRSRDSAYDQFVCRIWYQKKPLWNTLVLSTYGIIIMTLSRYVAVIYPIRYKQVRAS